MRIVDEDIEVVSDVCLRSLVISGCSYGEETDMRKASMCQGKIERFKSSSCACWEMRLDISGRR